MRIVLAASRADAMEYAAAHGIAPWRVDRGAGDVLIVWPRTIDRVRGHTADRIESTPAAAASSAHAEMLRAAAPCMMARRRGEPSEKGA